MLHDLRLALRRLLHARGFSISVVLILGAGVGAAAAMAGVLNALAFRPLNLPDPGSLVAVGTLDTRGLTRNTALPAIDHLRAADLVADGWCGYNSTLDATESGGRVFETFGVLMTTDCASVLRVSPVLGRWFTPEETPLTGASKPVMVISDRYWERMFDRDPNVLGREVRIENVTVTVIGVMPPGFRGFSADYASDFILPFFAHRPSSGAIQFIGRIRPGATVEQLRTQVRAMWPAVLDEVLPAGPTRAQSLAEWSGGAESFSLGQSVLRRLYAAPVQRLALLAAGLLILVCINVGGLLVARVAARAHETVAMRALGAGTWRILRPLAIECSLYAIGGVIVGVPIAYLAGAAFATLLPMGNAAWDVTTAPDARVFVALAASSVIIAVLIAVLPAWLGTRRTSLLAGDRGASRATNRWAKAMMVAQIAVTVVLVFTCGLIVQSFNGLRNVDAGFNREGFLSLRLAANPAAYEGMDAAAYYSTMIDRVAALPGVRSVALARMFGTLNSSVFEAPVGFADRTDSPFSGATEYVSPGFFATAGVPLHSGRDLSWADTPDSTPVAVISERLARTLSPDGDVIGRVIRHGTSPATARLQIVGVVGNVSMGNFRVTDPPVIYLSSIQARQTAFATVHIRTEGPPLRLAEPASAVIASLGREHVRGAYTEVLFTNSIVAERMGTIVSSGAAGLALVISCIGIFALMAHTVQRRTREIGIRMAIGATPGDVSGMVFRDALTLAGAGIAIGLPAAIAATRIVSSLLFGVTSTDGLTIAVSILLLIGTASLASALPARRAVRVDPAIALRSE